MIGLSVVFVLAIVGALAVALALLDSLWSVLELASSYLMPYFLPAEVQPLAKKFGPWAGNDKGAAVNMLMDSVRSYISSMVTGGTDGIGKQYAKELAARGISIVIVSRNPDKLRAVAAEIEKEHNVKTKIIVADFSKGAEVYSRIEDELKDIPVGILVNNVGNQYEYPMTLTEVPSTKAWELINVNVGAVTAMSKIVLPGMVGRGRGAVVNVSSGSELQPLPLMAVYAATKAYVHSFTLAIREEYSSKGVHVQHLSPLFVSTKMNAFSNRLLKGNLLVPDAATYSRHAVNTLGKVTNTTGYWLHGIQSFFVKVPPVWIRTKIGAHLNKEFREEYLQNAKIKSH